MAASGSPVAREMVASELAGKVETMTPPTSPRRDIGASTRGLEMPTGHLSYDIGRKSSYADADKSVDDASRDADVQEAPDGCNKEIPHGGNYELADYGVDENRREKCSNVQCDVEGRCICRHAQADIAYSDEEIGQSQREKPRWAITSGQSQRPRSSMLYALEGHVDPLDYDTWQRKVYGRFSEPLPTDDERIQLKCVSRGGSLECV